MSQGSQRGARPKRCRVDELTVRQGLAPSLDVARRLLMAGEIVIPNHAPLRSSDRLPADTVLHRKGVQPVSRGAEKLRAALDAFQLTPEGLICFDLGASTGGFTEELLRRGAKRVYAIDTAAGELAWKLRTDSRVVVCERINVLHLPEFEERAEFVTVDLSFTSLRRALPAAAVCAIPGAHFVALIKPHYEAPGQCGPGGVIGMEAVRNAVVDEVIGDLKSKGFICRGICTSPIEGGGGNIEMLGWFQRGS